MKKYTLYCGLNDKDTKKQEITLPEATGIVRNACLAYADGATIYEADGIYKHSSGELVAEKTLRVELLMVEQPIVRSIVNSIKALLNQESIAVQEQEVVSALW